MKKTIKKIINKVVKKTYSLVYKFVPVQKNTILFVAYHGRGYQCNPKYLHQYLINNPDYEKYRFVWAVKSPKTVEIPHAKVIRYLSLSYFYYLARSKYWIFNCKMPKYVMKKPNQIYVQTWHGTPLKRLGHDIIAPQGTTFYRSKMSFEEMTKTYDNDVSKYDYFISPNSFATSKFISSFRIDPKKILELGYPRNDYLSTITLEQIMTLKQKYNLPLDKKIILYAPTWRDDHFTEKGYVFELQVDFKKWKAMLAEEYIILFKPHYLITNRFDENEMSGFVYPIRADVDINDLYVMSDLLITDYSSVFFDYANLNRPIIFYMHDLETYQDQLRGFYLDIQKELPGEIFIHESDLLQYIQTKKYNNSKQQLSRFNQKYNYLQNGFCSQEIIKQILK